MRTKLLLSYSKADGAWRDLFVSHLKTNLAVDLWVDQDSVPDGADWRSTLKDTLGQTRLAVMLLTPSFLERGRFAADCELPMLLAEQDRDPSLQLVPVLVEPCLYENYPALSRLQLASWSNSTKVVAHGSQTREVVRALDEAGDHEETAAARESAIDRAVMEVCSRVTKELGVVGQVSVTERDAVAVDTAHALEELLRPRSLALGGGPIALEPIHSGHFVFVYRGLGANRGLAVKALPTAVWRNHMREALDEATKKSRRLRDPSFIKVEYSAPHDDVHAIVMEYIDWPTLEKVLATYPRRCLPPQIVAGILWKIARAQHDAHCVQVEIGPLSPASIYVNDDWDVRIMPVRIERMLARGLRMTGQLVNWDVLTTLSPEDYAGRQPSTMEEFGYRGQYYLALLGLQLLLGRPPVEVASYQDLRLKAEFFDNPRSFFEAGVDAPTRWTDESPALAFMLSKMLSREPDARFPSALEVSEELRRVSEGRLPNALRRTLEDDLTTLRDEAFAARFYARLFDRCDSLRSKFTHPEAQSRMLAHAVRDLVEFRLEDQASRFLDHAKLHRHLRIEPEEIEAFRTAFVAEVIATCEPHLGPALGRVHGDAWHAALRMGVHAMWPPGTSARSASGGQ